MKSGLFFLSLLLCVAVSAQVTKVPVGKKINLSAEAKGTMGMTIMGQEMNIETTNTTGTEIEFLSSTSDSYLMRSTLKRIKAVVTAMGTTQTIDSENESDKKNAEYADIFVLLNKPTDIEIATSKATVKSADPLKKTLAGIADNVNDPSRLVLTSVDLAKLVAGYTWEDSIHTDEGYIIKTKYIVNKTDEKGVEVSANASLAINTTISQMGMDTKTALKGSTIAKRLYNKTTGVLLSEEADTDITGEITVMDQLMPVSFKNKSTTTVN